MRFFSEKGKEEPDRAGIAPVRGTCVEPKSPSALSVYQKPKPGMYVPSILFGGLSFGFGKNPSKILISAIVQGHLAVPASRVREKIQLHNMESSLTF